MAVSAMISDALPHLSAVDTAAAQVVRESGIVVLDNIIPPALLGDARATVAGIIANEPPSRKLQGGTRGVGANSHRIRNLLPRHDVFRTCAAFEPVNKIVESLLGYGYLLFASAVNDVGPGEQQQRLHTDDMLIKLPRPLPEPLIVNVIWALSDFTEDNGATRYIPASHRIADARAPDSGIHVAEIPRGSILMYHGSLWHGAGGNTTQADRRIGMIFTYCARFIRPYENQLKLMSIATIKRMSPLLRQLAGFDYPVDRDLR